MRRFPALLCASLTFAWTPALAAIGTPQNLGNATIGTQTTSYLPLKDGSGAVAVGSGIIACLNVTASTGTITVTDSAGNSYSKTAVTLNSASNQLLLAYNTNLGTAVRAPTTPTGSITSNVVNFTTDPGTLAVDQSITGTSIGGNVVITGGISQWNGSAASASITANANVGSETITVSDSLKVVHNSSTVAFNAISVTGLATSGALDVTGAGTNATGLTFSIATGTINHATEITIGCTGVTNTTGTWTEASGFTSLNGNGTNTTPNAKWAYKVSTFPGGDTYAPSWTPNSRVYMANVYTFSDTGPSGSSHQATMMGIGH